jgi:hypothetical protein
MLKQSILPAFGIMAAGTAGALLLSGLFLSAAVVAPSSPPLTIVPAAPVASNTPKLRIDTVKPARRHTWRA